MYDDAGEVIREALRFMDSHEKWLSDIKLSRLREQLLPALNQLNTGDGIKLSSEESLNMSPVFRPVYYVYIYRQI
ncbi:hypothetical protein SG34_014870 [Thalassomonas viridans]|uniref:Uncharacterized protein n=1 Tax=Thalassomonas viridans TaxID=137584 RepID=A0AAE9Z779_9GAMM|nr:hypothetical protein [Thalassomonas viridans]WDE08061.1 hypothetical protein SG34_014870 [Thalassomonas viridans]